jgi:hypothetical protein
LYYDVVVNNLSGPINSAHFHQGDPGTTGAVLYDITADVIGNRIKGKITGSSLTTTLVNTFLKGQVYLNIHTTANPNGEIRGQVYRVAREGYSFSMDGSQEVPPVTTSAKGAGIVSIDRDQDNAHFMLVASGLTSNGVHFHKGVAGQTGGVLYDLTPFYTNNGAFGYWKSSDATPFNLTQSIRFRNDSVYVNIHTSANPNGEIRGQVLRGFKCFNLVAGFNDLNSSVNNLIVFPNPAKDKVHITYSVSDNTPISLVITDILGTVIYQEHNLVNKNLTIDVQNFPKGLYFIVLQNNKGKVVEKVMID